MAGTKAFDTDAAEEAAMLVFWERGYADSSMDALGEAMGLGRSSIYNAFGGKSSLFARCLGRYAERYGEKYDLALASHPDDLPAALAAFFDVTLARIAQPTVPRGCLIAQTVIASPSLPPQTAAQAASLLDRQRTRLTAALVNGKIHDAAAADIGLQLVAVNQSLAVLSRAGITDEQLQAVARTAVAGQLGRA